MTHPDPPPSSDQEPEDALGQPVAGEQCEEQQTAEQRGESEHETGHRTDSPR